MQQRRCPACGEFLEPAERFCGGCGRAVPDGSSQAAAAAQPPPPAHAYPQQQGYPQPGYPQQTPPAHPQQPPQTYQQQAQPGYSQQAPSGAQGWQQGPPPQFQQAPPQYGYPGGYPNQPMRPVPPAAKSGSGGVFRVIGTLLSLGVLGVGGWYGYTKLARPNSGLPGKSSNGIAQRRSGALTEFPVDTATTAPVKPVSVSTAQLRPGRQPAPAVKGLPPGVTPAKIRTQASTITSAVYQNSPTDSPVNVHVIEAQSPESLQTTISEEIAQGAGGVAENTGVQVTSPEGQVYRGRKIRTALGALIYVLAKTGASILILIYAPQPAGAPVAERLAANVGNGAGIYDYAGVSGAVTLLPGAAPAGLTLINMSSYAGSELASIEELRQLLGSHADAVKQYIPDRIFTATYSDAANHQWKLMAGEFGGAARAWFTWSALRMVNGVSGLESVTYPGGDGLTVVQDRERYLVFRAGSRIILVSAPAAERVERLAVVGQSLQ